METNEVQKTLSNIINGLGELILGGDFSQRETQKFVKFRNEIKTIKNEYLTNEKKPQNN